MWFVRHIRCLYVFDFKSFKLSSSFSFFHVITSLLATLIRHTDENLLNVYLPPHSTFGVQLCTGVFISRLLLHVSVKKHLVDKYQKCTRKLFKRSLSVLKARHRSKKKNICFTGNNPKWRLNKHFKKLKTSSIL